MADKKTSKKTPPVFSPSNQYAKFEREVDEFIHMTANEMKLQREEKRIKQRQQQRGLPNTTIKTTTQRFPLSPEEEVEEIVDKVKAELALEEAEKRSQQRIDNQRPAQKHPTLTTEETVSAVTEINQRLKQLNTVSEEAGKEIEASQNKTDAKAALSKLETKAKNTTTFTDLVGKGLDTVLNPLILLAEKAGDAICAKSIEMQERLDNHASEKWQAFKDEAPKELRNFASKVINTAGKGMSKLFDVLLGKNPQKTIEPPKQKMLEPLEETKKNEAQEAQKADANNTPTPTDFKPS